MRFGPVRSLNLSTAVAIVLFEGLRQQAETELRPPQKLAQDKIRTTLRSIRP